MNARTLAALALALPGAALAVDPGNWELTVVTMMSGQQKPISVVQTRCLTEADARDPGRVLSPGSGTCEFRNRNQSAGQYSFDLACTGALAMSGSGKVSYTRDSMEGDLDLMAGQGFGLRTFLKGRRLGPC